MENEQCETEWAEAEFIRRSHYMWCLPFINTHYKQRVS